MSATLLSAIKHFTVENAPKALKIPNLLVPQTIKLKVIEKALNTIFSEAIADADFDFLERRWVQIDVQDLALIFHISFEAGKVICAKHCANVDLRFSAKTNDLIVLMGHQEDPDSLFFQRRLIIEGDTEMGLEVKNLIDAIDFDAWPVSFKLALEHFSFFVANNSKAYALNSAEL